MVVAITRFTLVATVGMLRFTIGVTLLRTIDFVKELRVATLRANCEPTL